MTQAQIYQGTWEQIASVARSHTGRANLTLIVPLDEEVLDTRADAEKEAARVAAIHAARGSIVSEFSLVDDLHRERQKDKIREEQEIAKWITPSTQDR